MEEFSIFKNADSSQGSSSILDVSGFSATSQSPSTSTPKKPLSLAGLKQGLVAVPSMQSSPLRPSSATTLQSNAGQDKVASGSKLAKPLPASLIVKNKVITISSGRTTESTHPIALPESSTQTTRNVHPSKQMMSKINLSPKKRGPVHVTPIILLGSKRKEINISDAKPATSSESKILKKRLFSEEFLRANESIMREHISKKRHSMSYEGILKGIVDPKVCHSPRTVNNPKPFSQEVMVTLEAALEDSDNFSLSLSTFDLLKDVLLWHHPQAPHVKSEKLYHKAFAAVTMPDINESSTLLMAVGEVLSQANDEEWKMWTVRDQTLGVHWSFYSRVLNIATRQISLSGPPTVSPLKFRNAALLTTFLTDLVVTDYQVVMMRKNSQSSMIKCLIAELLWPTMTGLEPWFRRPSTNLADLVSSYVKSVENYVQRDDIFTSDDEVLLRTSHDVMTNIGRLLSVTASWCVCCDLRDQLKGKRTSTRTLEHELVSALVTELDNKNLKVITTALNNLPQRTALKVNVALIRSNCSTTLIDSDVKEYGEISLQMIASCLMKISPSFQSGDNKKHNLDAQSMNKMDSSIKEFGKASGTSHGVKAMKRNRKGETGLHIACIHNRPDTVRCLLNQRGIQPNATGYSGRTALEVACINGSSECVEVLLTLPLKPFVISEKDEIVGDKSPTNRWQIDITSSPANGQTPLHHALGNGHCKIACMLLEKGGVKLLDLKDSHKLTPLDYCARQAQETSILQFACDIAAAQHRSGLDSKEKFAEELIPLPSLETYEQRLPKKLVLSSYNWREKVVWLAQVVCLLISNYVDFSGVVNVCQDPNRGREIQRSEPNAISSDELEDYATDMMYCYRWKECWDSFTNHLSRLLGEDEESIAYVVSRCKTPISFDLYTVVD